MPSRTEFAFSQDRRCIDAARANAAGGSTEPSNPSGSLLNIAGRGNKQHNVAGLMPHPASASEKVLAIADGRLIFESMVAWLEKRQVPAQVSGAA